ncbi:DUF402 domain-containing protein [Galactobacter caseinivorans]|uniref:DUF402 domain-containing protein n=1 Tax=Galactobacter caseinivorans TaxID=2676123 RepID=A0A496PMF9_9MICC|nr:DUF402 domain-containing protein [Galactobacter caseinivorans]RKW71723.1 DUF402 domain-containing protein [Galactobacter caseinivorans]
MSAPTGLPRRPAGFKAGDQVVCRAWKYNGLAHWVVPGIALGSDQHGEWIFQPAGSFIARPGMAFFARSDAVTLVPVEGEWIATFHSGEDRNGLRLYIDISTRIGWAPLARSGWEVHSIDMDLDVVERTGRGLYLDDEDEFEEHAAQFGYPPELMASMRTAADELMASVGTSQAPFDGAARRRFDQGRALIDLGGA